MVKKDIYNPISLLINVFHVSSQSIFMKLKYFLIFMLTYAIIIVGVNYKFDLLLHENDLGQFHLLFSFCLTIIISFRINTAYSRWWEARGLWGSLVNNSRNLSLKIHKYIGFENDPDLKKYILTFPLLLKYHLRRDSVGCMELIKSIGINHNCEYSAILLIQKIINKIVDYRQMNQISFEQYLSLDQHIVAFTDILGACEKILNTPPPHGFAIFTRLALLFYMFIFPFGWVQTFEIVIIPILIVIIYVLMGLEVIAEEIEAPFGVDYNCLDLETYANNIKNNVNQIANMPRE